ncbi:hypothetical protein MIMGU_mgv1a013854mg [Erythranthe guttata]|uniref:Pectinesterase inhibitor domain-containing protein n=1 Tax=Erythranthe guttata TaxID=4155 RepID=A0A022Q1C6_ERYGU|nr:hypothetical protein MIMGU_mgv1a013854mg [Erythranthe guttata]
MKLPFLVSSFLFTILLTKSLAVTSSSDESTTLVTDSNEDPITVIKTPFFVIVTDDVIARICYQTTYASQDFCRSTLYQFKGSTLFPMPLASVLEATQTHARKTAKKIWRISDNLKYKSLELKTKYDKCLNKYTKAANLLNDASKAIRDGKPASVRMYTSMAAEQVQSCNRKLNGNFLYGSQEILEDNRRFADLASMITAICNILSPGI